MSGIIASLFRPGAGSTIANYTAAVAAVAMYPGDWVALSTTAPASQGVAGVYAGKTLGTFDYIECELFVIRAGDPNLCLGVLMGKGLTVVNDWENVGPHVLADGDVGVIQCRGVHPQARQLATAGVGDYLMASSTAGAADNVQTAAAGITGITQTVGAALVISSAYTRAAADHGGAVYISRCT